MHWKSNNSSSHGWKKAENGQVYSQNHLLGTLRSRQKNSAHKQDRLRLEIHNMKKNCEINQASGDTGEKVRSELGEQL